MSDDQDEQNLDATDSASTPADGDTKVDDLDAASTEGDLEDLDGDDDDDEDESTDTE
jgi:hypothetical protein